jgi:hypothetical protein
MERKVCQACGGRGYITLEVRQPGGVTATVCQQCQACRYYGFPNRRTPRHLYITHPSGEWVPCRRRVKFVGAE